jgi:hypothetical protein
LDVVLWADSSYDNLPDGRSVGSYFLSVGRDNAPFHTVAKALDCIAMTPMDSEYINASNGCKALMHFRFLSTFCGWEQKSVNVFLDSQTAINLATAPQISKKSLHLDVKHHYIRECHQANYISIVHVLSADQRANVLTKYLGNSQFLAQRDNLLNVAARC